MYLYRQRPNEMPIADRFDDDNYPEFTKDGVFDLEAYDAWNAQVQVAYWRKANAIHAWFVDTFQGGVDECQYSDPIGREALAGLVQRCKRILSGESEAADLLPTRRGFFFGTTEYDEWYEEELKLTIEQLEPLLAERNTDTFVYHSSW